MKVIDDLQYNPQFPEKYTWGRIDSIKFSDFASTLVNRIEHSFHTDPTRNEVAGLRAALNEVAQRVEVYP